MMQYLEKIQRRNKQNIAPFPAKPPTSWKRKKKKTKSIFKEGSVCGFFRGNEGVFIWKNKREMKGGLCTVKRVAGQACVRGWVWSHTH